MEPHETPGSRVFGGGAEGKRRTQFLTLLLTDIAGSTQLKSALGDQAGVNLIQRHHSIVRELLKGLEAEEISTAGDSFLLAFSKPSHALLFALRLQVQLRLFNQEHEIPVQDRIGLHLGEVVVAEREGKRDIHGMQVDTCARVMSLAKGGQILMTRSVFDNARQSLKGEEIEGIAGLEWLNHGRFELKGVEEPVEICEVRAAGSTSLSPPTTSEKAHRVESSEGEAVLGWRPALGTLVPNTQWLLEQKLGEGGFGEVWLGRHQVMKERRVFKFCFRADRVRSLKREMTLFRLIKERIGDHPNIVALREVYFEQPPYYVEEEYVAGQDLASWCAAQGGADKLPLETRLEIIAQIADALQAAHDAGVIHRDVKPANILVSRSSRREEAHFDVRAPAEHESEPPRVVYEVQAKLTDFGIGQVISEEALAGVTRAGFTQTMLSSSSSQSGTQLYMAPELWAGKPASTRSDIYSLGVVLFQLLVGDFSRPVTTDWARAVPEPLLREDLEQCFAGNIEERFAGAGQLAKNLRNLRPRTAERLDRERLELRARQRQQAALLAGAAFLILALVAAALGYGLREARSQRDRARLEAYFADVRLSDTALRENNPGQAMKLLQRQVPAAGQTDLRGIEWRVLWERCQGDQTELLRHNAEVSSAELSPDGRWLATESGGSFWLWDLSQPKRPQQWLEANAPGAIAEHLVFEPQGRFLATAGATEVSIWDPAKWQRLRSLTNGNAALSMTTNGTALAVVGNQGVQVWDTIKWELLLKPGVLVPQWAWDLRAAISPEGSLLAVSSTGREDLEGRRRSEVVIWRLADHSVLWRETGLVQVTKLAFSDDGQWLAACTWGPPATIHLWLVPQQKRVGLWPADDGLGMALAFAPGGQELVSAGSAQLISRWRTGSTNRLGQLKGHLSEVWSLRFARDGRLVSGSKDGTVRIWKPDDLPPNRRSFTLPAGRIPVPVASGARKLTTFKPWEWVFEDWDLATGQLLAKRTVERGEDLLGGGKVSTNAGTYFTCGLIDIPVLTQGGAGKVGWLCIGAPGWELFATTGDGWLHGWSAETGRLLFSRQIDSVPILSGGLSPDRQRFETMERSGTMKVWNIQGGEPETVFDTIPGRPYSFGRSSDGALSAFLAKNRDVVVWDVRSRKRAAAIPCVTWGVGAYALAISPDKRLVAVANNNWPAKIWEIATGRAVAGPLYGHLAGIDRLSFSPDSRLLVTHCADRTAKVWSVETGQEVLSGIRLNELLHVNPFWQLFPDSNTMVEAAETNAFRLVHLPTLAEIDAKNSERQNTGLAQQPREGLLQEWLVLGPLPLPRLQSGLIAMDDQQLANEHQLRPRAGEAVRVGPKPLVWRRLRAPSGMLELDGPRNEYCAAYAVCYLRSERARSGLVMHVGSDDQAKVYLNGQLLLRCGAARTFAFDQNTIKDVSLQAGLNVLVLKLVNETGDWRGSIGITDEQGRPVDGVRVSVSPD